MPHLEFQELMTLSSSAFSRHFQQTAPSGRNTSTVSVDLEKNTRLSFLSALQLHVLTQVVPYADVAGARTEEKKVIALKLVIAVVDSALQCRLAPLLQP